MTSICEQQRCKLIAGKKPRNFKVKIGKLTPSNSLVQRFFEQKKKVLKHCGNVKTSLGPFAGGTLIIEFVLNEDGSVAKLAAKNKFKNAKVTACIMKRIKRFRFPKPEGEQNTFRQTISFK